MREWRPGEPGVDGPPPALEEGRLARMERETRLTLAAVTLVGLQSYLEGLDPELFRYVTLAALRAAALKEGARAAGGESGLPSRPKMKMELSGEARHDASTPSKP
jgi:hypothetical protein